MKFTFNKSIFLLPLLTLLLPSCGPKKEGIKTSTRKKSRTTAPKIKAPREKELAKKVTRYTKETQKFSERYELEKKAMQRVNAKKDLTEEQYEEAINKELQKIVAVKIKEYKKYYRTSYRFDIADAILLTKTDGRTVMAGSNTPHLTYHNKIFKDYNHIEKTIKKLKKLESFSCDLQNLLKQSEKLLTIMKPFHDAIEVDPSFIRDRQIYQINNNLYHIQ